MGGWLLLEVGEVTMEQALRDMLEAIRLQGDSLKFAHQRLDKLEAFNTRSAALEEAAKVLDQRNEDQGGIDSCHLIVEELAAAIRALKDKP
jgi:hypothetical protein